MAAGFSTLRIPTPRINWMCGSEQKACYPDKVIERLARCFYPAILEQAEQARCSAKEKQDVPDGERPAIHTQLFSSWVRSSERTLFIMHKVCR